MRVRTPFALLALAALAAACVGSPMAAPVRTVAPSPVPTARPTILASVAEDLARLPEVYALTDTGDVLPAADTVVGAAPAAAGSAASDTFYTRIAPPTLTGPRRVGIQAGHWLTEDVPPSLWRLVEQKGTSWGAVREVDINLDVAKRVATILEGQGIVVDILPATIPAGYAADAFVALHADGDGTGASSGFKLAHGARRTPYEDDLVASLREHYGAGTGLPYDSGTPLSLNMTSYYAFSWERVTHAASPLTPSTIIEMGYVSNDGDRELLTERADEVAAAIAEGIVRFLDAHPREELFGKDLLVPSRPQFSITS